MFYFRATKSFHVNRRSGGGRRTGTNRMAPGRTTFLLAFTPPRRRPGVESII
jgi:hypothetical protein